MKPWIPLAIYTSLALASLLMPEYARTIAAIAFFMALGQAVNIFVGLTGYVDFGYVAFIGMGAYGLGITLHYWPELGMAALPVGFALGVSMAVALAAAVGGVALRLRGAYFAIATIGVNEGVKHFIIGANIWGGGAGLILGTYAFKAFGRDTALWLANVGSTILILAIGFLAVVAMYLIQSSKSGYALAAIRQDEDAAKVMGINTTKYKLIAFMTSASLAGSLGAAYYPLGNLQVFPENVFFIEYILDGLAVMFIGGAGTVTGPIVGGVIYIAVRSLVGEFLPGYQLFVTALLLMAVVILLPKGIVGTLRLYLPPRLRDWLP